ncbi:hypothetical protein EVAR_18041_1 [Eumeta japonica]|uniref:Uncharacterized protein n=1 Tax=Eumeta variegata TaxID=151549 RepID=A0A4C1XUS5_EUMVA|nr:hypothetical protein EVAR_18041_1 [Eumeta japonica]
MTYLYKIQNYLRLGGHSGKTRGPLSIPLISCFTHHFDAALSNVRKETPFGMRQATLANRRNTNATRYARGPARRLSEIGMVIGQESILISGFERRQSSLSTQDI